MPMMYAQRTESTYENFIAECPHCREVQTYNRVSDLKTTEAIGYMKVTCLDSKCSQVFAINGDSLEPPHRYLLDEAKRSLDEKRYMASLAAVAQAYETLFSLALRVAIAFEPFAADSEQDMEELNDVERALYDNTERYSYTEMRNIVTQFTITELAPKSLGESVQMIATLPLLRQDPPDSLLKHPLIHLPRCSYD